MRIGPLLHRPDRIVAALAVSSAALLGPLAGPAVAQTLESARRPAEIEAGIEGKHPAAYLILADKLFEAGERDRAVFWFYLGQLRYRTYLQARPTLPPHADPALFASLFEMVGRRINPYAFGDIPALARVIDQVLAWDASHDDTYAPKERTAPERAQVRQGLARLRDDILARQEEIRADRARVGLENR